MPKFLLTLLSVILLTSSAHSRDLCSGTMSISPGMVVILCPGDSVTLTASGFLVEEPFTWSTGAQGYSITINAPGMYSVHDASGCGFASVQVMTFESLAGNGSSTVYLCEGQTTELYAAAGNGSILWSDGSTGFWFTAHAAGQYSVTTTFSCGEITHFYDVVEVPSGNQVMPLVYLCEGESISLQCPESVPGEYVQWGSGLQGQSITVTEPGEYIARITKDCLRSYRFVVEPNPDCPLCEPQLPNVFTPNADGSHDWWMNYADCEFTLWELHLFDRWGNHLFYSGSDKLGWDGNQNGKPLPAGVYFFQLTYGQREKVKSMDGSVTLLR